MFPGKLKEQLFTLSCFCCSCAKSISVYNNGPSKAIVVLILTVSSVDFSHSNASAINAQ